MATYKKTNSTFISPQLLSEVELLRDIFISKAYPRKLVGRTMNDSWKVELKKEVYVSENEQGILDHKETEENTAYFIIFNTPSVPKFSERLAKDQKHRNVGVTFCKSQTVYNYFCKFKPPCSQEMRQSVIDYLGCK